MRFLRASQHGELTHCSTFLCVALSFGFWSCSLLLSRIFDEAVSPLSFIFRRNFMPFSLHASRYACGASKLGAEGAPSNTLFLRRAIPSAYRFLPPILFFVSGFFLPSTLTFRGEISFFLSFCFEVCPCSLFDLPGMQDTDSGSPWPAYGSHPFSEVGASRTKQYWRLLLSAPDLSFLLCPSCALFGEN